MANPEDCLACGASAEDRPQIYRGDPWCSDTCHKEIAALCELPQSQVDAKTFWQAYKNSRSRSRRKVAPMLKKEVQRLVRRHHEAEALRVHGVQAAQGS